MPILHRRSASLKKSNTASHDQQTNAEIDPDFDHIIVIQDNTKQSKAPPNNKTTSSLPEEPELQSVPSNAVAGTSSNVSSDSLTASGTGISRVASASPTVGSTASGHGHRKSSSINWKKDSLRKHLAERKYRHNWKTSEHSLGGDSEGSAGILDDEELAGASSGSRASSPARLTDVTSISSPTAVASSSHSRHFSINTLGSPIKKLDSLDLKDRKQSIKSKRHVLRKRGHKALQRAKETGRRYRRQDLASDEGEIDVLYENQRGWYFFGIPLFSSKSLLPTDSAAWTTKFHTASPVTTADAQLPDPSWHWVWRSWFVDMTGDVDEEGWQYSFAFRGTRWHGVAVWWHSFVRRRRWVRKRVKKPLIMLDDGTVTSASRSEYFTIHSRKGSTAPEVGGSLEYPVSPKRDKRPSSVVKFKKEKVVDPDLSATDDDDDDKIMNIDNIPALLKAFKKARLDREKLDAMEEFIREGGQEVVYLTDAMPIIMSSMIFQTSRRRLLAHLIQTELEARDKHVNAEKGGDSRSINEEKKYINGLNKAIDAAEKEVRRLEYWSDVKKVEKEGYAGVNNADHLESDPEWDAREGCIGHEQEVMATTSGDTILDGTKVTLEDVSEMASDRTATPKLEKGKERAT